MADRNQLAGLQRRVVLAGILMSVTFILGIVGYRLIGERLAAGRYGWLDAVYMTANVLTTTGFREVVDISQDSGGQIFTVFLLVFGAVTVVYFTTTATALVVEGHLTQGFRRRRMERAILNLDNHYIICGAGATGLAVLRELVATKRQTVIVEANAETAAELEADFPALPVLVGDFTDDETLIKAGIGRATGIVICTDNDKDSLVATVTARQLNPRIRVVARAAGARSLTRLRHAGADAVVSTDVIGGMRMASELIRPSVVGFLDEMLRDKNQNLRIEEVEVPRGSVLAERTLAELGSGPFEGLLLLAIRDPEDGGYIYNPPHGHRVVQGAQLIVMGGPTEVRRLRDFAEGSAAAPVMAGGAPDESRTRPIDER